MARTNRNNKDSFATAAIIQEAVYKTAIYARLSVEDNGCGSDSIDNQIYMIKKYVNETSGLFLVCTYADNGMTGTNFDRPGFISMLDQVKKGEINCIVVKDLSRFGRNYMETGNYLENIFPYLGVRFISINDHYDSVEASANEALALSLKNVYHHIYAKDISRKICTLFDVKKKNGLFLGKFAPYGYKKSDENHYKLEIDEQTAPIVRDIFRLRLEGFGISSIAKKLNESHIPSQYRHLYEIGRLKGTNGEATALWSGSSVLGILENPNYYGCMVERKSDGAYYKGKNRHMLEKAEWKHIENTHEAIIDKATFETTQNLIAQSKQKVGKERSRYNNRIRTENVLRGIVVCGTCHRTMDRDSGYYDADGKLISHRFRCRKGYLDSGSCEVGSITEADLVNSIFTLVKAQISLLADMKQLLDVCLLSSKYQEYKNGFKIEINTITAELSQIKIKILKLYQDYKKGLLTEHEYILVEKEYEAKQIQLEMKLRELEEMQRSRKVIKKPDTDWMREILNFQGENCLTRELCIRLINRVEVFRTHITVYYTFCSEYESFISVTNECVKEVTVYE